MDSMLIEGVQLWVYRRELQAFFAAALRPLATCCFRPKVVVHVTGIEDTKLTFKSELPLVVIGRKAEARLLGQIVLLSKT